MVSVGDMAPDFTLPDQFGEEVSLSKFKGKKVILSFHPLAWTSVCAEQVSELEALKEELDELNAVALSISVDPVPTKRAWAKHLSIIHTTLLSDFRPHGKVSQQYGLFDEERGISKRAVVVIDEEGKVIYVREYPLREKPDMEEVLDLLRGS